MWSMPVLSFMCCLYSVEICHEVLNMEYVSMGYSISQEICTRFLLCCALLWLYIDWFSHIHQVTLLALWQSNDCPSTSKATLMNMDKYFMWIHYERLRNHNKAKHNKTVWIFLGIYYMFMNGIDDFRYLLRLLIQYVVFMIYRLDE